MHRALNGMYIKAFGACRELPLFYFSIYRYELSINPSFPIWISNTYAYSYLAYISNSYDQVYFYIHILKTYRYNRYIDKSCSRFVPCLEVPTLTPLSPNHPASSQKYRRLENTTSSLYRWHQMMLFHRRALKFFLVCTCHAICPLIYFASNPEKAALSPVI